MFVGVVGNPRGNHATFTGPTVTGTAFVLIGALVMALAAVQHVRFSQSLTRLQRQ